MKLTAREPALGSRNPAGGTPRVFRRSPVQYTYFPHLMSDLGSLGNVTLSYGDAPSTFTRKPFPDWMQVAQPDRAWSTSIYPMAKGWGLIVLPFPWMQLITSWVLAPK